MKEVKKQAMKTFRRKVKAVSGRSSRTFQHSFMDTGMEQVGHED